MHCFSSWFESRLCRTLVRDCGHNAPAHWCRRIFLLINPQGTSFGYLWKTTPYSGGGEACLKVKMGCEILTYAPAFADEIRRSETIVPGLRNRQNWFAVYTRTHHEKSVMQHLTDRGIESFLPLYKAARHWTNYRKVFLDLPLFPNYVFVHISLRERVRTLEVPGVVSLV